MKQKDKELLFKDLCARLYYHVRCKIWLKDGTTEEGLLDLEHNYGDVLQHAFYYNDIKNIKPYLRPLSSMTEVEKHIFDTMTRGYTIHQQTSLFDWLNAHHFDYRGLIEKGLALEAPKGMYNIKEE